jgi:hypothetical protein
MSVARGTQGFIGYVASGLSGVHRDPTKWIALKEPPTITNEIVQIDSRIFAPGAYHQSMERLQGMFNVSGSFVMALHPSEGIEFLKGILGTVTSTELTGAGSGIYEHEFVGSDVVPMPEGFSVIVRKDLKDKNISGLIVTSVEIKAEVNGEVIATVNWIARKCETVTAGTQATSQGQNAVSLPVTFVVGVSDDFKLAIDGGTAYECTITAGAYATAAALEAAINAAILAQTSLQDSDGLPEVACYVDSANKVNFYTADKGIAAAVAWTAGTHTASTLMGMGTVVEAAGTATAATPTYSSVQPYLATQLSIKQDTVAAYFSSVTLNIDSKIVPRNCLGSKFFKEPKLDGKREITLTLVKEYEDESAMTSWAANSDVEFEMNLRTGTEIVAASGVNYDADIYIKKCRINNSPEPTFNAQGALTQEIGAMAFYEDATYKDIKIDLNNDMSSI